MWDQGTAQIDREFLFGPFRLSARQRLLLENGEPVRLGSRAIEMLIVLIERTGELVRKDELIARVWPRTVVVAANLTSQMTGLRRALRDGHDGNRYIVNDSGRGYRFVAPVTTVEEAEFAAPPHEPSLTRLLEICQGFVGRSSEAATVDAILRRGIEALELARALVAAPDQADGGTLALARYASRWGETHHPVASH